MLYYIFNTQKANGVKVIVQNLIEAFNRKGILLQEVNDLSVCSKNDFIIAFGVKECHQVAKRNFINRFALLVDAISLGYRNKIKFYLRIGHIFHYDFFYSIYGYIRYSRMEMRVIDEYDGIMLVSPVDIDYLKKKSPKTKCKFYSIPNGAYFINAIKPIESSSNKLKLGILSSWITKQTTEESNWFVQKWYSKFTKEHSDVELLIAGRGPNIKRFKGLKGITVMGEVESLSDFFNNIDVFLTLNPKGCGILNRVLDAISYGVPVAGINASFSGFPNSDDVFTRFDNYDSFCNSIDKLRNTSYRISLAQSALEYAHTNNDWLTNYDKLAEIIINSQK